MTSIRFAKVLTFTACFMFTAASGAMGKSPPEQTKSARLQQSYVWHDGDTPRRVWLDPNLVAEFGGKPDQSAVRKAAPGAREVPQRHASAVRIWEVDNAEQAIAKARGVTGNGEVSPVFRDAPGGGRLRAAPGNVIVYLNPEWSQGAVEQWAARNRAEIVQKLDIGPNIYVVKSGPGLDALQKANALRESGEVLNAFPNWWQETATR